MKFSRRIEFMTYHLIKSLITLIGLIPPRRANRLAHFVGHAWFKYDTRHRIVAMDNLTHVFGDSMDQKALTGLARRNFVNTARIVFEMGQSTRWPLESICHRFRYYGLNHVINAHKKGKGVLLVMAHIGNWELAAPAIMASGFQSAAVYRTLDFKPLDRYTKELRQKFGCRMYPTRRAVYGIRKELFKGNLVGLLIDQNASKPRQSVFVDFLGRKASANKGLAFFAMTTDVPVISFFVVREKGKFRAEFGPEVPVLKTGDPEKDLVENTQAFNRVIEEMVRRYPDQWFWIHRRWKTRPLQECVPAGEVGHLETL